MMQTLKWWLFDSLLETLDMDLPFLDTNLNHLFKQHLVLFDYVITSFYMIRSTYSERDY